MKINWFTAIILLTFEWSGVGLVRPRARSRSGLLRREAKSHERLGLVAAVGRQPAVRLALSATVIEAERRQQPSKCISRDAPASSLCAEMTTDTGLYH